MAFPGPEPRTDWLSVVLALLVPSGIAAASAELAFSTWEPTEVWWYGLLALPPLDMLRALLLGVLGKAYENTATPRQAVGAFLVSAGVLMALILGTLLVKAGPVDVFHMFANPMFYTVVALPLAVLIADSVIGLLTFRGDHKFQAAQLDALSEDLWRWLVLFLTRLPFAVIALVTLIIIGKRSGAAGLAFLPEPDVQLARLIGFSYLALYFAGKGVLAAYVHTARFARTRDPLLNFG